MTLCYDSLASSLPRSQDGVSKRSLKPNENVQEIVSAFREVMSAFDIKDEEPELTDAQRAASKPITAEERRRQLQASSRRQDPDVDRIGQLT